MLALASIFISIKQGALIEIIGIVLEMRNVAFKQLDNYSQKTKNHKNRLFVFQFSKNPFYKDPSNK